MYIIVLTLFLQTNLHVEKTEIDQRDVRYSTQKACDKRATALFKVLPKPPGAASYVQSASCKKL